MDALAAHAHDPAVKKQRIEDGAGVPGCRATHDVLDVTNPGILNASNPQGLAAVLAAATPEAEPIKSDCDEQLLLNLTLAQPSKIHSVRIGGGPDVDMAPKTIKIFANRNALSFDDVEDLPPTQTLELRGMAATLPLQFVKFQSVTTLSVFIQDNQSDGEVTCLSNLEFIGTPLATTNMSDLKKGG